MKQYIIAIDGGTTNTRASLWEDPGVYLDIVKSEPGVRITSIEGSNASLKAAVKSLLEQLLQRNSISYDQVEGIYACGMLTSKEGLAELPHLIAPAGKEDFLKGLAKVDLPDVCPLPIHFVRGLKNRDGACLSLPEIEERDVMRGEETETLALLDLFSNESGTLFALPGSYTKFVSVDAEGKMIGCLSSLAGELLSAVTLNTILASALKLLFEEDGYFEQVEIYYPSSEKPMSGYGLYQIAKANTAL